MLPGEPVEWAGRAVGLSAARHAAKSALAEEGYDPQFGARPLKRIIQQCIENPIATQILAGDFEPGDTIKADYQGKSFVLERTAMPPATERVEA